MPIRIYRVSNKKTTQVFGSCSRTRVPISFKLTMNIVRKMAKIIVTKANSLAVLPHLECVLLRSLHFCCFHWTRRSLLKKFGWDDPKTRFDFEKCPEQKDKSLRTPLASNHDRNRLGEMFDKAVNHHRSADLGPARGDQPEVGLHRASFSRACCG